VVAWRDSTVNIDRRRTFFPVFDQLQRVACRTDRIASGRIDSHCGKFADKYGRGQLRLIDNIAAGVETPLTSAYRAAILAQTKSGSLEEALISAKVSSR